VFGPDSLRAVDFDRQALHAGRLVVKHPATGATLAFEAPLPRDMKDLVNALRAERRG
jgi:23S rRNA pseudouridine1911/1915/1917 synthase